jgi:hypothetical protein
MTNPFQYDALPEDDTPCPEQYFSVSADYNQWMGQTVEIAILERHRQGGQFDEITYRKINAVYGQYVGIYALMPSVVYEHKIYEMQTLYAADESELRQIWQDAVDNNKQIILHLIVPIFQSSEGVTMQTGQSVIPVEQFMVHLSYV